MVLNNITLDIDDEIKIAGSIAWACQSYTIVMPPDLAIQF